MESRVLQKAIILHELVIIYNYVSVLIRERCKLLFLASTDQWTDLREIIKIVSNRYVKLSKNLSFKLMECGRFS